MSSRLKVLQVLEATTGGTRRHLHDLATGLDADRFEVHVLCSTRRDAAFLDDVDAMRARGIEVRVVPMVRAISPLRDLYALARIVRYLRASDFDVVHTHSSKAGFLGRAAARMARVPLVVHTPHGFPFEMKVAPPLRRLYLALERAAGRLCDRIVCVCAAEQSAAIRAQVIERGKLVVIENGIPQAADERARPGKDELRRELGLDDALLVGMAGRFARQKGHRYLVDAMRRVVQEFPGAVLVLAGDGRLKPAIKRRARRTGLEDRCRILETRDDLSGFYAGIDVLVFPSLWEGLPYTLLEGMAAGCAVVATDVGGMRDVLVAGQSAELVPAADAEALAEAICALLRNPQRRDRLGAAARQRVRSRFRVEDMVRCTEKVYTGGTRA